MDRIPPEILASIMEYVAAARNHQLSRYASVSYRWQPAIERVTFRSLQLSLANLDTFQQAFQGDKVKRRGYVRHVQIQCSLPWDAVSSGCCSVTRTIDREVDSEVLSKLYIKVFQLLDDITQRFTMSIHAPAPISLEFLPVSRGHRTSTFLTGIRTNCTAPENEHSRREIQAARARPGMTELQQTHMLRSLPFVSSMTGHCWGRSKYLHPSWICKITENLPFLRHLHLYLEDAYDWGCIYRKQYQSDLGAVFAKLPAYTLETLHLKVWTHELLNEDVSVHKLSTPGCGDHVYDDLLRRLSVFHRLRFLYLVGPLTVSPTLFSNCESDTSSTIFPLLEEFALEFTPATSDGRWFYIRDDAAFDNRPKDEEEEDESDDEEIRRFAVYGDTPVRLQKVSDCNKYRSLPCADTFTPFLTSAGRVCARMPKIKKFSLKLNNNYKQRLRLHYSFVDRVFDLWFVSAGSTLEKFNSIVENPRIPLDAGVAHHNRVYFRVGNYRPDEEILKIWRHAVGADGKIYFLDQAFCGFSSPSGWKRMKYDGPTLQEA